jgi:uncharacterized membrane protein YdjX (TVP38/TMEM64 family)
MASVRRLLRSTAPPVLLIAGLAGAGYALRTLPIHDFALHAGRMGDMSFVLVGAIACAVGLPRQLVPFAAGYAHGVWFGALLALVAQLLGCVADLLWARLVAGRWVKALPVIGRSSQLARLDAFLATNPFMATLTLRLLPVGNNLALNLLAGALRIRVVPFLAATAFGYLPQTIIFVLLGKGIRVARGVEIGVALAAFVVSTGFGLVLFRRSSEAGPSAHANAATSPIAPKN